MSGMLRACMLVCMHMSRVTTAGPNTLPPCCDPHLSHPANPILVQVVVLDQVSVEGVLGPTYLPVWQKVMSPQRPPVLLKQLVADARLAAGRNMRPGAALCFRGAGGWGGRKAHACGRGWWGKVHAW